jgi:hypothetical protein
VTLVIRASVLTSGNRLLMYLSRVGILRSAIPTNRNLTSERVIARELQELEYEVLEGGWADRCIIDLVMRQTVVKPSTLHGNCIPLAVLDVIDGAIEVCVVGGAVYAIKPKPVVSHINDGISRSGCVT